MLRLANLIQGYGKCERMCGAFQVETVNGNGVGLFGRFVNIDTGLFDCAVGE